MLHNINEKGSIRFTYREREILHYYAAGSSPGEIHEKLEANVATVNLHLRAAMRKAGLVSRSQLHTWIRQNQKVLIKGGSGVFGLRSPNPDCPCSCCKLLAPQLN